MTGKINKKKFLKFAKHKEFFRKNSKLRCQHKIKNCVNGASNGELRALSDCAKNLYKRSVTLPTRTVNRLRPYKKQLKALSSKPLPIKKTRAIFNQKGGFAFVPILASIAASLLGSVLFKNG